MGSGACVKCQQEKRPKPCKGFFWNGVSAIVKTLLTIHGNSANNEAFRKCMCGHHFIDHE